MRELNRRLLVRQSDSCLSPVSQNGIQLENTYVGPFLIIRNLGNRRQRVYHARQVEQERDVALKFLTIPETVSQKRALQKIEEESSLLQKLRHPNLVPIYGAGVDERKIFLAAELVEGESLDSILMRRGKLPPDVVVDYGKQLGDFLEYLHSRHFIHTSLSPEKILITPENQIKVLGLRVNRSRERRWDIARKWQLEEAAYMAPEQFKKGATQKSDLYSMGVLLYEMLTGKLPYPPDTLGRMAKAKMNATAPLVSAELMNCPFGLDKLVSQLLSPAENDRTHSAHAVSLTLKEIQKIDSDGKAAVSQVAGGFNSLTAGVDKTEANELLGLGEPKPKVPLLKKTWVQFLCLLALVGLSAFLLWPASSGQLLERARPLIDSDKFSNWQQAIAMLEPVAEQSDSEQADQACTMIVEARRKVLVLQAPKGLIKRTENECIQEFRTGFRLEQGGDFTEAIQVYRQLTESLEANEEFRYVFLEADSRLKKLKQEWRLPSSPEEVQKLMATSEAAETRAELKRAKMKLERLIVEFSGTKSLQNVVIKATQVLRSVEEKLKK